MNFDDWSLVKRALLVNILGVAGVWIGVATTMVDVSNTYAVRIGLLAFVLLNFLFLAVRPRIMAARRMGAAESSTWHLIRNLLRERWIIAALIVNQLVVVSHLTEIAVLTSQRLVDKYIRGFYRAPSEDPRFLVISALLMLLAAIWLSSAVGLWRNRSWGWWLAVVLNGLVSALSLVRLFLSGGARLIDGPSTAALIVLLLPTMRNRFLTRSTQKDTLST